MYLSMVHVLAKLIYKYFPLLLLFLIISVPSNALVLDRSVHHLLPFTKWEHLKPCEEVLNVEEELNKALECSNKTFFNKPPYNMTVKTESARCYVVTEASPDLKHGDIFNYLSPNSLHSEKIMGFYDSELDTIFLVDTKDIAEIYRHEMQHYFLQKYLGDGDGGHTLSIWKTCESQYYNPYKDLNETK